MQLNFLNRVSFKIILMLLFTTLNVQGMPISVGSVESIEEHRPLAEGMVNLLNKCLNVDAQYKPFKKTISEDIKLGILQSDIAFYAFGGFENIPHYPNLRTIGTLHPENVHILVRNSSGITKLRDMVGKVISIGSDKSNRNKHAQYILETVHLGTS